MAATMSLDAIIKQAEDYFQSTKLSETLACALKQLSEEQPKDGLTSLCALLSSARSAQHTGDEASSEEVEAIDFDTLPDNSLDYEPMALVTLERLPSSKSGRGRDVSQNRCWAAGFSRPLLDSWLPQPSPCCAAASVAGAFNALFDYGRAHAKSSSIREVAELMAQNCDRLFAQRQQRVERLLHMEEGGLTPILTLLDSKLAAKGLDWTASGAQAAGRNTALSTLREMLSNTDEAPTDIPAETLTSLRAALVPETEQEPASEELSSKIIVSCGPDWDSELGELFAKRRGSMRLRATKPNTGEIGSWGVKQAFIDLASARSSDTLQAQVLLGRKGGPKVDVAVSKDDDRDAIDQQWSCLKGSFDKPNSALLFHLTNHYALIYAWREWTEPADGEGCHQIRRQILTARKGQRPTVWLDFDEARSIMLSWSGYHILQVQRSVSAATSAERIDVGIPGGA